MIFNHRSVSLAVFGSLALSSASTIGGSSNALSSAASTDQHTKQQNHRARRVKKAKSTIAADDLGVDQMSADNRVDGGADATSKKSSKADAPVATPVTPATTSGPTAMVENKINDEEEIVLPLNVANDTVVSEGGDSDELKPILTETFYMHHVPEGEDDSGGNETKAGGDDNVEGDGNIGNDTNVKPIGDNINFYEDYVPDEGVGADEEKDSSESDDIVYGASPRTIDIDPGTIETPTVSPTTPSPTHKPTTVPPPKPAPDNDEEEQVFCAADVFVCSEDPFVSVSRDPANDCAFPPCPLNAPIVPPPTDEPTKAAVALPENSCFEENDVFVCIYYYEDLSCDKIVDGTFCNCCRYHPTEKFVSTFDCTNVGDEWGQMGLCEPGPMPIVEEKEDKILEEDGLSILSLDYGEDDNDMAADAISIAWSTAGGDVETDSKFVSLAVRQRRGRRRAQAVRRRAAATKKRREAMVK